MLADTQRSRWRRRTPIWLFIRLASVISLILLLIVMERGPSHDLPPVPALALLAQVFPFPPVSCSTEEQAPRDPLHPPAIDESQASHALEIALTAPFHTQARSVRVRKERFSHLGLGTIETDEFPTERSCRKGP